MNKIITTICIILASIFFIIVLQGQYRDFFAVVLIFGVVIANFLFLKRKKNSNNKKTSFKKNEPVEVATASETGFLYYGDLDIRQFIASLVYLAIKGYLVIREVNESERHQFQGAQYIISWKKNLPHNDKSISMFDTFVFTQVFSNGYDVDVKKTIDLFNKKREQFKDEMIQSLLKRKYYVKNPKSFKKDSCMAVFLYAIIITFGLLEMHPLLAGVAFLLMGVWGIVKARSTDHIEYWGYNAIEIGTIIQRFMSVLKTENIKSDYQVEEVPKLFEKFLPYAIIFENEKKWELSFEGLLTEPFDWYESEDSFPYHNISKMIASYISHQKI